MSGTLYAYFARQYLMWLVGIFLSLKFGDLNGGYARYLLGSCVEMA